MEVVTKANGFRFVLHRARASRCTSVNDFDVKGSDAKEVQDDASRLQFHIPIRVTAEAKAKFPIPTDQACEPEFERAMIFV